MVIKYLKSLPLLAVVIGCWRGGLSQAADWQPVAGHIMSRWAAQVDPKHPLPEYPRPQMVRQEWINLNGLWDYAIVPLESAAPESYDGKILVPYPVESALSGVKRPLTAKQRLWYHRTFRAPDLAGGKRLLLHFGAVDWEAKVSVNGRAVGEHRGGYDPFTLDITDAVTPGAENQLVVAVFDPTGGFQPKGKQNFNKIAKPGGIAYSPSSGLWQTVWLEAVPTSYIETLKLTPDVDAGVLRLKIVAPGVAPSAMVQVVALDGAKVVGRVSGPPGTELALPVKHAHRWTPSDPFLYTLKVQLGNDEVTSYFGMRKIAIGKDKQGMTRVLLNGKFIFQAGPLDQGFWPDGLYTAPTDEALRFDIEEMKKLGFNMVRKHLKVEPERWYYWCDKLGLLVWQDMPCGDGGTAVSAEKDGVVRTREGAEAFEKELKAMIATHDNHPSIIMWIVFNEGWGQYDTPRLTDLARTEDPTRLLNSGSGWFLPKDCGDVIDRHKYKGTVPVPPDEKRIGTLGEFGGFGFVTPDNQWIKGLTESSVYGTCADQRDFEKEYLNAWRKIAEHDEKHGTSAAIYTQLTDVEAEVNGLLSYDRKVIKADVALFANAVAKRKFPDQPTLKMLLPTSQETAQQWSYTEVEPAAGWEKPGADLSGWKRGSGVFGHKALQNGSIKIGTEWTSLNLWVVRTFELPAEKLHRPVLRVAFDDNATVYINGVKALSLKNGNNASYRDYPLHPAAAAALRPGTNTLAIHVDNQKSTSDKRKNKGSQFIDAGIGEESITW
jgi:hypothetical protein